MRIIGGSMGGRVLKPAMKGWPTRPTTDLAKEALYNILQHRIDFESMRMLELFGGTAAHTLEVVSRGCSDATYVDSYHKCVSWTKEVATKLEITDEVTIVRSDVKKYLKRDTSKYTFIFADPPYALHWMMDLPDLILDQGLLAQEGVLIIEHSTEHDFGKHSAFQESRNYGQTEFSFFGSKG